MTAPLQHAEALARIFGPDGLRVLFQPIVQRNGRSVLFAVEALVRGPERSGLEAAEALLAWARTQEDRAAFHRATAGAVLAAASRLPERVDVAINMPAQAFLHSPTFVTEFLEGARRRKLAPSRLILEIHDAPEFAGDSRLLQGVADLRMQGTRVAIDGELDTRDMRAVHALAPDLVKLDWRLVRDSATDPFRRARIAECHRLARALGARTVAEGVETTDDEAYVRSLGIDLVQGHLFGKPQPLADLLEHPLVVLKR